PAAQWWGLPFGLAAGLNTIAPAAEPIVVEVTVDVLVLLDEELLDDEDDDVVGVGALLLVDVLVLVDVELELVEVLTAGHWQFPRQRAPEALPVKAPHVE